MHGPHSKIATHGSRGGIYIHPKVPDTFKGIKVRQRLERHERVEYRLMKQGLPYSEAHREALKAEHKGLTMKEISRYEGLIGSIARHG